MFIKELEIERFKAIDEKRKFNFSKVNLIVGDNGSGKSALLAGISYPIVDTVTLSGRIEDYCNWNHDKKYFYINHCFEHVGQDYRVEIEYKNKTFKTLTLNDSDVYENKTATDVLSSVIDPKLTHYSAISNQHSATDILFETPAKRLDKLKTVLGLEKVGLAADYLKEQIAESKSEIEQINTKIITIEENRLDYKPVPDVPDISDKEKEFETMKQVKENFDLKIKKYKSDIEKLNKKKEILSDIESKQEKMKSLDGSFTSDKNYESELESKNENFYSMTAKLDNYNQNKKRAETLQKNLEEVEESKVEIEKQIQSYKDIDYDSAIGDLEIEVEKANEAVNDLSVNLKEFENKLELAEKGLCHTCGQEFHGDTEEIKKEQADAKKRLRRLKREKKEKQEELDNLKVDKDKCLKCKNELTYTTEKLSDIKIQLEALSLDESVSVESVESLKKEINKLEDEKKNKSDYEKLEYEVKVKQDSLPDINESDIEKPEQFDSEKYEKLLTLVEENVKLKRQRESAVEYNSEVDKQIKQNKRKVKSIKKQKENLQTEMRYMKEARQSLDKEFSAYLIDKGTSYIRDKMNEFFQKTYGRYYVDFKQDKNSVEFFYSPDNEKYYSVSMASGFEKQLLAISFRLALCNMQNLNFLILDEIDSDASDENSMNLYSNILDQAEVDQVFIVTHHLTTQEMLINDYNAKVIEL